MLQIFAKGREVQGRSQAQGARADHPAVSVVAVVERAKLADFHFHDPRHTVASWAVQRGATLQEVKDLLGHSSLAMVMRVAHLSPEHLRTAVARLDAALPRGRLYKSHKESHVRPFVYRKYLTRL